MWIMLAFIIWLFGLVFFMSLAKVSSRADQIIANQLHQLHHKKEAI